MSCRNLVSILLSILFDALAIGLIIRSIISGDFIYSFFSLFYEIGFQYRNSPPSIFQWIVCFSPIISVPCIFLSHKWMNCDKVDKTIGTTFFFTSCAYTILYAMLWFGLIALLSRI